MFAEPAVYRAPLRASRAALIAAAFASLATAGCCPAKSSAPATTTPQPGAAAVPPGSYLGVDVSTHDVPGVKTSGLYSAEQEPSGTSFRWTNGNASFSFPAITERPRTLHLELAALVPSRVNVVVAGKSLVRRSLAVGRHEIDVDVGALDFRRSQTVRITSDTWRPPAANHDPRRLGVEILQMVLR